MMLMAAAALPKVLAATDGEVSSVKQLVIDWYRIYYTDLDKDAYRKLLTEDYLLLENGEIFDAEKDLSLMPTPEDEYRRNDTFDFHSVKIQGDTAYSVYFLKSDIRSKQLGSIKREWLESIILRRGEAQPWQVALLHSTKLVKA